MRRYQAPDVGLFLVFSVAILGGLAFVDLTGVGDSLVAIVRRMFRGDMDWFNGIGSVLFLLPILAIPAFGLGYVAQALAVRWGFRLTRRPNKEHRADYEDKPPARFD